MTTEDHNRLWRLVFSACCGAICFVTTITLVMLAASKFAVWMFIYEAPEMKPNEVTREMIKRWWKAGFHANDDTATLARIAAAVNAARPPCRWTRGKKDGVAVFDTACGQTFTDDMDGHDLEDCDTHYCRKCGGPIEEAVVRLDKLREAVSKHE